MQQGTLYALLIILAILIVLAVWGAQKIGLIGSHSLLYPLPKTLPSVVDRDMKELLADFERSLTEHAPGVLESLQPGLPDQKIDEEERKTGIKLPPDLRELYKWRNGQAQDKQASLFPTHTFFELGSYALQQAEFRKHNSEQSLLVRLFTKIVAGHRLRMVELFPDGCGDGYFYDPKRKLHHGSVHYGFIEDHSYVFFPSPKNLIAAITECYNAGVYYIKPNGEFESDFEREDQIMARFGTPNEIRQCIEAE